MGERHVVITGASRGIGRAIADHFLGQGFHVWSLVRSPEKLAVKPNERAVAFDAQNDASVVAAAKTVLEGAPRIDALVNNAGISLAAPLTKTSPDDLRRLMQVNVTAPFVLCQALMPAMAKAGGGRVVNIASTAALKGFRYTSAYCATKHALLGLTRALAHEYATKQVTVNAVCPGWTETDMLETSVSNIVKATGRSGDDARAELAKMTPSGRFVSPKEVAELTYFLAASEAGRGITGSAYAIDGGETL